MPLNRDTENEIGAGHTDENDADETPEEVEAKWARYGRMCGETVLTVRFEAGLLMRLNLVQLALTLQLYRGTITVEVEGA